MPRLPSRFAAGILCFAALFRQRSWRHAEALPIRAVLAPGPRPASRLLGLRNCKVCAAAGVETR